MHTCPECGNTDMRVRTVAGATLHECGLCGARFGDRWAIDAYADLELARERGVPPAAWPLVRALEQLPGVHVRDADAGGTRPPTLPWIELGGDGDLLLVQLENLAKSLQLGAGALRCHWVIEVEYRRHLAFVLKPRHGGGAIAEATVLEAQQDLAALRRNLERDCRLGWWRHAAEGPNR